jgi:predicted ribosome quality control (RQC) complex YloA/Tae2 family protein
VFDLLTIAALADEFAARLVGGRVQKTIQLDESSIGLEIYAEHQRHFVIASADSRNPRLYISSARTTADPDRVTPLLLLLRKYVRGGQIVAVQQPPLERIVRLSIAKRFFMDKQGSRSLADPPELEADDDTEGEPGDAGEIVYVELVVEIMGRRSNIMLVDDNGRIHDAIKRVTPDMSRVRPILPGRQYAPPPPQERPDPRHLVPSDLEAVLHDAAAGESLASLLVARVAGVSPQMAREAVFRATGATDSLVDPSADVARLAVALAKVVAEEIAPLESGDWSPSVYLDGERVLAFSAIKLAHLETVAAGERFETMSAAVERALSGEAATAHVRHGQRRSRLEAEVREGLDRAEARLHSLEEEQRRAREAERWREMGELIYAYLYQIEAGDAELSAHGQRIPLDPTLSPSENAQTYFDRYRRAQSATRNLPELVDRTQSEVDYLRQLHTLVRLADGIEEIEQLRREWDEWTRSRRAEGDTREQRTKGKRVTAPARPRPLRATTGDVIYVGHNGRQNELVTFEIGRPDDTWLHARNMPGAHVIVHWAGPRRDDVIEAAARLAAWFSAGRDATSVEVDATDRRHVRKIKGAGPGMVTYRNEHTLNVRPASPKDLGLE